MRARLVYGASYALSQAITIAIRYSAVRRQTAKEAGQLETQVRNLSVSSQFCGYFYLFEKYFNFCPINNFKQIISIGFGLSNATVSTIPFIG